MRLPGEVVIVEVVIVEQCIWPCKFKPCGINHLAIGDRAITFQRWLPRYNVREEERDDDDRMHEIRYIGDASPPNFNFKKKTVKKKAQLNSQKQKPDRSDDDSDCVLCMLLMCFSKRCI